jgi:hypothetical protein
MPIRHDPAHALLKGDDMWLLTNFGFFSIVQKKGTKNLTIRARMKVDLDELRGQ